ncbi:MAG TPA: hypothetical protein VN873_04300 [Candidatus Angelobacter sp.]|nr:hypothetical protein [Candidatus Angelobacter sp.]
MKSLFSITLCVLTLGFNLAGGSTARAANALTADQVIAKAVARGRQDQDGTVPDFVYRKQTVTDQLDSAGKVKEHREKLYEISYRDGRSHATLLQVNGHAPSESDLKQQSDNDTSIRQITGEKNAKGDNREQFLTADLAARFDFKLVCQTNFNGRPSYEISFQPKSPELPVHHLVDRLLNQLSGTLWIDANEFEVARADVSLRSEVNLLGGILGSLKKLDYTLQRTRMADGVWFSTLSSGDFQGRKLLDATHIKTHSQSEHFRRVAMNEDTRFAEN